MTDRKGEADMTTAKVVKRKYTEVATKEEVEALYEYFTKKNKSIYEKLAE